MKLVIDASVALKWVLGDAADERDLGRARALLVHIVSDAHQLVQPPHWLLEIVAVMSRRHPDLIGETIETMRAIDFETANDDAIYLRASELASRLKQHAFDTMYHAVALEHGATLITADERYFADGRIEGQIELLQNFELD